MGARRTIAWLLPFALLAGCGAAVSSTRLQTLSEADVAAGRHRGEVYYLPRAVLMARVLASPSRGLRVVVDQPDIVADTGAPLAPAVDAPPVPTFCVAGSPVTGPFVLSHRITGFHKDTITIATDRSLLTSVVADTEEQTTEALANLAKSVGALSAESGEVGDEEELLAVRFDPADCGEVAAVNALVRDAIDGAGAARLREMRAAGGATGPLARLALAPGARSDFALSLSGFAPFRLPPAAAADCRVGVCVPVQVPASIAVSVGGRRRESPVLHLPNRSDPVAIPVSRSGFADVKTTLTLDHGVLTRREVVRTSEVASILLLPATLVGAYLDELSSTFKKRKTALDDAEALRAARQAARADAEAAAVGGDEPLLEVAVPGMSVAGGGRESAPLQARPLPTAGRQAPPAPADESPPAARETQQGDGTPGGTSRARGAADGARR